MYNHLTLQMYDLTLTTSVAKSATWGKPMNPRGINRGAVAESAIKVIRVLSGRRFRERRWSAGCAIAPPAVMHGLPSPMAHPRGSHCHTPLQHHSKPHYNISASKTRIIKSPHHHRAKGRKF